MANPITRGRGVGSPARRSMTAAARAAAKRTARVGSPAPETPENQPTGQLPLGPVSGRTLRAEERVEDTGEPDWEAPDWKDPDLEHPDLGDPDLADPAREGTPEAEQNASEAEAEAEADGAPSGVRRRLLVIALLAVLALSGLVGAVVLGLDHQHGRQAEQARHQALAAAREAAPVVLSYDYRHLDRDFAAARGHLTGSFRDEYLRTTKAVVAPTARKYQGVVKATVVTPPGGGAPAASVVSASPDKAVVLLFVNQVTRSTQVEGPRVDLNRVRMTLEPTSGGWKVAAVDAL
ncbi:hypothetical protein ACFU5O_05080 [Streptomyces sp. NPDC057445]|uniref:hypothetical protein n=1 Tax=Streptomyces sp. NPDC057445 TaxID=3346136 RepID=UPI0036B91C8E